jgi:hypothetical protein
MIIARRTYIWGFAASTLLVTGIFLTIKLLVPTSVKVLTGVVIRADQDPKKQVPVDHVEIKSEDDGAEVSTFSEANGLFQLKFREGVYRGREISLRFRHSEYSPYDLTTMADSQLYVIRLTPLVREPDDAEASKTPLSNVRVRYAVQRKTTVNVGSATRIFEVKNSANVPCGQRGPCSPDRKWKAAIGRASLDAGESNEFENARVSCVAGPCPFTNIAEDRFSIGGRTISVTMRNWSDTATFLLEAEVKRTMRADEVRQSYPMIFGHTMSFSLPAGAESLSIQSDLNGSEIIFPMGPKLRLSWAICTVKAAPDESKLYRCELKPGYRFATRSGL